MLQKINEGNKKIRKRRQKRQQMRLLFWSFMCVLLLAGILLVYRFYSLREEQTTDTLGTVEEETEAPLEAEEPEALEEEHVFTVCIDPGHGGKDIGANSGKRLEKDDTLALGLALQKVLEEREIQVVMTRDTDDFLKLSERNAIANDAKADYLVSIHRNKGKGNGAEIWISANPDTESSAYADAILTNLEEAGISRNRGIKKGSLDGDDEDYAINRDSLMASSIIELGFVNSQKDNQLFDDNLESYAKAIADGILDTWQLIQDGDLETEEEESLPARAVTAEGSTDPEGNITSIHLENEQIDEDKDTTLLEWGQGRNFDELNRPGGCLMYQQKYGDELAYFLGPWEEGEEKVIYLTFDIGYTNESTVKILDTLKGKEVKAVFFATLPVLEDDDEIVNRIIDEGHELGNHSATHPSAGLPSESVEEQREEVMKGHNLALEKYNYEMHLFRFPAGKFSEQSLAIVNNCNYRSVFWSYAHQDWNVDNQPDVSTSLQAAVERLHPGAIYLLHGISSTNAAMLGDLIDQAREQGYTFGLLQ